MKSITEEASTSPARPMPFAARPMQAMDVSQVADIEREAFPTMLPPTPFKRELTNRLIQYMVAYELKPPAHEPDSVERMLTREGLVTPSQPEGNPITRAVSRLTKLVTGGIGDDDIQGTDFVAGYTSIWYMSEEGHVVSIAVRESHRGRGIGELLLISGIKLAIRRGCSEATLEVRKSNYAAQALYEKYGFTQRGIRKGYYTDNREDANIMTTLPIQTMAYQNKFEQLQEQHAIKWGTTNIVLD